MTIEGETTTSYPLSPRNRVKRLHERGSYDRAKIHGLLDASMLCHVSYVVDGQPYCTPTFFWREGNTLYWHGSSASRMLRNQSDGQRACLTVAHLDSLVLARCGFNHSADYRAVMAFGTAHLVDDPAEKERALVAMVDRFFPDRTASLRQSTAQEIKATSVIAMEIEAGVGEDSRQGRWRRRGGLRIADLCRAHSGAHRAGRARTVSAASRRCRASGVAKRLFGRPPARRCIAGCAFCALRRRLRSG